MNFKETMAALKSAGTTQNIKIYKRHGAKEPMFGVSFANLKKLKKQIKINHDLALQLWNSKNMDARTLATMVADPQQFTKTEANKWLKECDYYMLSNMIANIVAETPYAKSMMEKLIKSKKELQMHCGYSIMSSLSKANHPEITKDDYSGYLDTIAKNIHQAPNRGRSSMNWTLISIGAYQLPEKALKLAKEIGPVAVDHGDTSCKTPDAYSYIQKTLKYQDDKRKRSKKS